MTMCHTLLLCQKTNNLWSFPYEIKMNCIDNAIYYIHSLTNTTSDYITRIEFGSPPDACMPALSSGLLPCSFIYQTYDALTRIMHCVAIRCLCYTLLCDWLFNPTSKSAIIVANTKPMQSYMFHVPVHGKCICMLIVSNDLYSVLLFCDKSICNPLLPVQPYIFYADVHKQSSSQYPHAYYTQKWSDRCPFSRQTHL